MQFCDRHSMLSTLSDGPKTAQHAECHIHLDRALYIILIIILPVVDDIDIVNSTVGDERHVLGDNVTRKLPRGVSAHSERKWRRVFNIEKYKCMYRYDLYISKSYGYIAYIYR